LIARGRTAEVFAWQEGQILKLFYDWCPAHWVRQEVEVSRAMAATTLPVPRLIETLEISGRKGVVFERVDGPSLLELSTSKPWLLFPLARQLAELHTQIHSQTGTGFPSLRTSLKSEIQQMEKISPELKTGVLNLLEELPDGTALCHFDFHPGQVLISGKGPVVIDWSTACQGNPLADVARTSLILTVAQAPGAGRMTRTIINQWRSLFESAYLKRYLELNPDLSREAIFTWRIPVAAARLKESIP
jgi:aminoglycoside phosphotransferase (APT) family kinase protein